MVVALPVLALALLALPAAASAGQVSVSVAPKTVSLQGGALGAVETLKGKLRLEVVVHDSGRGEVKRVELNPLEPSAPVRMSVVGPVTVMAVVKYGGKAVLEFNVWPDWVREAGSDADVGDGHLVVSVQWSSLSVNTAEGVQSFNLSYHLTFRLVLPEGKGSALALAILRVKGEGISAGTTARSVRPHPGLARLFLVALVAAPVALALWSVAKPALVGLLGDLAKALRALLSPLIGSLPLPALT